MSTVWTRPVPPGITAAELDGALEALTTELGPDKVLLGEAELREFRDPFQHASSEEYTASAVVMPTTVEEIQAILRIANERRVPVWTHGQGRNNGYGGPAPRVTGCVIVSLRNMNQVLEINEELGYAVVEPGVRWFDLYEAIEAQGASFMLSIADLGWGSVVGDTLEHGGTYLPYGLDFGMQCGIEVVLADGTVMRTGMGAMEGNKAWHCYKRGLGPTPDQMFMQSNFGIVTKMGVWLMPKPEVYMPLWLTVPRDDDIAPLIDTLRTLMLDGTIRMVPQIMNSLLLGAVLSTRGEWYDGAGVMPDEAIEAMTTGLDIGRWTMRFALYEDDAVADHKFAKIKAAFEGAIPGAKVWGTKHDPADIPDLEHPAERIQGGAPVAGLEQHDRLVRRRGGRPLHGPRDRPVRLQRPRVPQVQREDQGRPGPQRDPVARHAGHLARAPAQRRALASERWLSSSTPPSCPRRSGSTSGTRCRCGSSSRSSSRRPRDRSPAGWSTTGSARSACGT